MILSLVVVAVIGIIAGATADELLRGRDSRSARVVSFGVAGALAGLIVRGAIGGEGLMIEALTALLGALLLAFAARVRISAAAARAAA
jgi:hypothetical protein